TKKVEAEKDLIAYHNTTESELLAAIESGGLAMPSLAITRKDIPYEHFGKITLVGNKALADPEQYGNKIYERDIYSPTLPEKMYDRLTKKSYELFKSLKDSFDKVGSYLADWDYRSRHDLLNEIDRSNGWKAAFLEEKGVALRVPTKEESFSLSYLDTKSFRKFVEDNPDIHRIRFNDENHKKVSEAIKTSMAEYFKGKPESKHLIEMFTKNNFSEKTGLVNYNQEGKISNDIERIRKPNIIIDKEKVSSRIESKFTKTLEREYKEWATKKINDIFSDPYLKKGRKKLPYTLGNIIDQMRSEKTVASQKTMVYGPAKAAAAASKEYKSIKALHKNKGKLVTNEVLQKYIDEIQSPEGDKYRDDVRSFYKYDDIWESNNDSMKAISFYLQGKPTRSRMEFALRKNDFVNVSKWAVDSAMEFAEILRDTPTQYFEGKLRRGVGFNEFAGVVIPDNSSAKLKSALKEVGLKVKTYRAGNSEARQKAVESFHKKPDVLFATKATIPQDTITRADLKEIFSGMKNIRTGQDKDGNFYFGVEGKPKVTIYEVSHIDGYINTSSGQIPIGSYLKNTIELKTSGAGPTADVPTVFHEFFHWLKKNGFASNNDIKALDRTISQIKGIDINSVTEEDEATYVGNNLATRHAQKNSRIKRILKKIADFMNAVYEFVARTRTARGVLADISSGKILSEKKEIAKPKEVLTPAYAMAG
ncbi:MAG: hypothetical protein ABIC04_07705, partial [Nanoarchaeota archaeon]